MEICNWDCFHCVHSDCKRNVITKDWRLEPRRVKTPKNVKSNVVKKKG